MLSLNSLPEGMFMKHLRLALPFLICLSVVACNNPKKVEKSTPTEKKIVTEIKADKIVSVAVKTEAEKDEPATLADVDRYYEALEIRDQIKQMTDIAFQHIKPMLQEAMKGQPSEQEELYNDIFMNKFRVKMTEEMLQSMAPIYAKHFTKNEMNQMIAFFSTPIGKKVIAKTPAITQEAMQISFGTMQNHAKKFQEEIRDLIEQMEKEHRQANSTPSNLLLQELEQE